MTQDLSAWWRLSGNRILLGLALVMGALVISAVFPWLVSAREQTLLIGAAGAVAALVVFMRWPPVSLVALIVVALVVPSPGLPGGLNVAVIFLGVIVGLWLLDVLVGRQEARPAPSRPVRPLLALMAATLLAFGIGQLPWFNAAARAPLDTQLGGVAIFILGPGAFLLVAYRIRQLRWLQVMTWVFLAIGALHVAGWLLPYVDLVSNRLLQMGAISNSMFWVWMVALAFSQALINRQLHPFWRLSLLVLGLATIYVCFVKIYDWKSGWIPALTAVGTILVLRFMGRHWWIGVVLLFLGIVAAIALGSGAIATDEYSYSTRLDAWIVVLEMVRTNPVTGFGPANYYFYTPLFPLRGYYNIQFNSHNQYVDIIAQIGLLGLACVGWFFAEIAWLGWRLRNDAPPGFAQAYVYGVLGGVAGTAISGMLVDWFLPFVYNIGLIGFRGGMLAWVFMGGLVSIELIMRRQQSQC